MSLPSASRRSVVSWFVPLLVALTGCDTAAVSWSDPAALASPRPLAEPVRSRADTFAAGSGAATAAMRLLRDLLHEANATTALAMVVADMPESRVAAGPTLPPIAVTEGALHALGQGDAPLDSAGCARSVRVAIAPGRGRVAVWWSQRDHGRVWLLAAWRDTLPAESRLSRWRGPIVVDTVDRGPSTLDASFDGDAECTRAAPSVVVDDSYGYVHVGYALTGPEGPGVFYAHQMDPRSAFESPLAIVYGESPGIVRVAAQGAVVAVAYEDPNSGPRTRIALAVSRTSGHTFEERIGASSGVVTSRDPFVAVRGRAIAVGWTENPSVDGTGAFRIRRAIVRP